MGLKPQGLILDGAIRVGSFTYIQGEDFTKCKIVDVDLFSNCVNYITNRSSKLRFMIVNEQNGIFKLVKDLGIGVVEGGMFTDGETSYFRDVRFIPFNKNSELN